MLQLEVISRLPERGIRRCCATVINFSRYSSVLNQFSSVHGTVRFSPRL